MLGTKAPGEDIQGFHASCIVPYMQNGFGLQEEINKRFELVWVLKPMKLLCLACLDQTYNYYVLLHTGGWWIMCHPKWWWATWNWGRSPRYQPHQIKRLYWWRGGNQGQRPLQPGPSPRHARMTWILVPGEWHCSYWNDIHLICCKNIKFNPFILSIFEVWNCCATPVQEYIIIIFFDFFLKNK